MKLCWCCRRPPAGRIIRGLCTACYSRWYKVDFEGDRPPGRWMPRGQRAFGSPEMTANLEVGRRQRQGERAERYRRYLELRATRWGSTATNAQLAARMGLSPKTIRKYRHQQLAETGAHVKENRND